MATSKKPAKKQPAKKQPAKKQPAKKQPAKKAAQKPAQPRKRPEPKNVIKTQPATATSTTGANVTVTITTPDFDAKKIAESVSSTVVRANDIASKTLRERVLRWFKRGE